MSVLNLKYLCMLLLQPTSSRPTLATGELGCGLIAWAVCSASLDCAHSFHSEHTSKQSPISIASCRSDYVWLMVIGSFAAFMAAWGIGANDVANSFATSEWMNG